MASGFVSRPSSQAVASAFVSRRRPLAVAASARRDSIAVRARRRAVAESLSWRSQFRPSPKACSSQASWAGSVSARQLAALDGLRRLLDQQVHPHAHRLGDQVAHGAGAVVELGGGLHQDAAALERVAADVAEPRVEQRAAGGRCPSWSPARARPRSSENTRRAARIGGELQLLLGAEVGEQAALAHPEIARPGGRSRGPRGPRTRPAAWPGKGSRGGWSWPRARRPSVIQESGHEKENSTTVRIYAKLCDRPFDLFLSHGRSPHTPHYRPGVPHRRRGPRHAARAGPRSRRRRARRALHDSLSTRSQVPALPRRDAPAQRPPPRAPDRDRRPRPRRARRPRPRGRARRRSPATSACATTPARPTSPPRSSTAASARASRPISSRAWPGARRPSGVERFTATVLSDTRIPAMLRRRGWRVRSFDGPTTDLEADVWTLIRAA